MPTPPELKPNTSSPCPGCGRPVALSAALCTHCGQHIRAGVQLATTLGRAEHTGPPPVPAVAPGPGRFRAAPTDENGRRILRKSLVILILCAGIVMAWKAAETDRTVAAAYAARLGICIACGWAICILESMVFLEIGVNIVLAALGIAASLAAGDLTQHIIHYAAIPTLAWALAAFVCIMCLSDLLDLEYPDAAFLGLAIYLVKLILSWTLFRSMFEPSA